MPIRALSFAELIDPNLRFAIIAPHVDDELIGCYSLFSLGLVESVHYIEPVEPSRMDEAKVFCKASECVPHFGAALTYLPDSADHTIYCVPSPTDRHPLHRIVFHHALDWKRAHNYPLLVYSIDMYDYFVHELPSPDSFAKHNLLNNYFPSQRTLWEYDFRYFLFEGLALI